MRFSRSVPRYLLAASAVVGALAACNGDRLRPGPPELTLTGPAAGTVYSPDTVAIAVHAADANGLDSIAVGYLGQFATINAFAKTEANDVAFFYVPAGLTQGQQVVITGIAVDLSGQSTTQTLTLTVIARP